LFSRAYAGGAFEIGTEAVKSAADLAPQTAGGIKEVLPVAEIMRPLVAETEAALSRAVEFR
jgi:hypothetical protein